MKKLLFFSVLCVNALFAQGEFYVFKGGVKYRCSGFNGAALVSIVTVDDNVEHIVVPSGVKDPQTDSLYVVRQFWSSGNGGRNVKSITLPNVVFWLGQRGLGHTVFANMPKLESVILPNSLKVIGGSSFHVCSSLKTIRIPDSVTTIEKEAFSGCSSLEGVEFDNVGRITFGDKVFYGCSSLKSIDLPNQMTAIGNSFFEGCSSLMSVTVPNTVKSIGDCAFLDCASLETIELPNSVTSMGASPFSGCTSLKSFVVPDSIRELVVRCFWKCSGLESVFVSRSVEKIYETTFDGCTNIKRVVVDSCNQKYDSRDNCNAIIETATNNLFLGFSTTEIPNTVRSIGDGAFRQCRGLKAISFPNLLRSIGMGAFVGCTGLKTVDIPNSVTSISSTAFYMCDSLRRVRMANGVTSIGDNAFGACGQLEEVVLPTSLTNLGAAFSYSPIKTLVYLTDSVPCAVAFNTLKTVETVCVLESMVSKFKETEYWRDKKIKPYDGIPLNTALDLNGDWKINSADVVVTYNWISDSIVLEDGEKNPADLNQDGTVNSADVVGLYNYIEE